MMDVGSQKLELDKAEEEEEEREVVGMEGAEERRRMTCWRAEGSWAGRFVIRPLLSGVRSIDWMARSRLLLFDLALVVCPHILFRLFACRAPFLACTFELLSLSPPTPPFISLVLLLISS